MKFNRTTLISSLGAGLEYYDFIVYALMTPYISLLFFPENADSKIGLMQAFTVFSLGYLARPIGGVLFGAFGDTFGRKKSFWAVMLLMAGATFFIGLLPTYEQTGWESTLYLVLLRVAQGMSFGAEVPGAVTFLGEHTPKKEQGGQTGILFSNIAIGSLLATSMVTFLSSFFTKQEIINYAWRLPFLSGGVLGVVCFFVRYKLKETPQFLEFSKNKQAEGMAHPISVVIKNYKRSVGTAALLLSLPSSLIVFGIFSPTYFSISLGLSMQKSYQVVLYGMIWSSITMILSGRLVDKFGGFSVLKVGLSAFLVGALLLMLVEPPEEAFCLAVLVTLFFQTLISLFMSSILPMVHRSFPVNVRFTAISLSYNIAIVISSFLPRYFLGVSHEGSLHQLVWGTFFVISGISLLTLPLLKWRCFGPA